MRTAILLSCLGLVTACSAITNPGQYHPRDGAVPVDGGSVPDGGDGGPPIPDAGDGGPGACVPDCAAGETCVDGECQCGDGPACVEGSGCCDGTCRRLDTTTDCLACGVACEAGQHESATCDTTAGCVFNCDPNFRNCNGGTDGCEQDLLSGEHCGACNMPCDPATEVCADVFGVIQCTSSCSGSEEPCNGACVNTSNNVSHCGICNMACPDLPNSSPICMGGGCSVFCDGSFGECDGNTTNGCEPFVAYYPDDDGDGYGATGSVSTFDCPGLVVSGRSERAGDCDDTRPNVSPGEAEICDGVDNDCDGGTDNGICAWACGTGGSCDDLVATTAGWEHQCVLRRQGTVQCVGSDDYGELGVPGGAGFFSLAWQTVTLLPQPVRAISAGGWVTCAIAGVNDEVFCWGRGDLGMLGNGGSMSTHSPQRAEIAPGSPLNGVSQISVGFEHVCARRGTDVFCWGSNASAQLGFSGPSLNRPGRVVGASPSADISAGSNHTCSVTTMRLVECWGNNGSGELGRGSTGGTFDSPTSITGFSGVTQVSAGRGSTCAVTTTGQAYCWGRNTSGQLGNGTTADSNQPRVVTASPADFTRIDCGYESTCALRSGGRAWCWGSGVDGSVGDGTNADRHAPVETVGGISYVSLESTGPWVAATAVSGPSRSWGFGPRGQLGQGSTASTGQPTPLTPP